MINVICWVVIHTSQDGLDDRKHVQVRGTILRDSGDNLVVNFSKQFEEMRVDTSINDVIALVNESTCLYE